MSASSTATRRSEAPRAQRAAEAARKDVAAGLETIRSTAADVGDRMPGLIDDVRSGATSAARTIEAWPESTRRTVAALSIGLGAGLVLAGAPRLLLGVALLPALAVAATEMRHEASSPRSA